MSVWMSAYNLVIPGEPFLRYTPGSLYGGRRRTTTNWGHGNRQKRYVYKCWCLVKQNDSDAARSKETDVTSHNTSCNHWMTGVTKFHKPTSANSMDFLKSRQRLVSSTPHSHLVSSEVQVTNRSAVKRCQPVQHRIINEVSTLTIQYPVSSFWTSRTIRTRIMPAIWNEQITTTM